MMVNPYKSFLKLTTTLAAALLLSCVVLIYIFDPFQIYHTSYFHPDKYIGNQDRFQTVGLINRLWDEQACCDAILLGTSHSQNFDGEDMGRILDTKPVLNLSMSGAKPYEQEIIFDYTLSLRHPHTVFWEIDEPFSKADNRQSIDSSGRYMPAELYNNSPYDDGLYLFSLDSFIYVIKGFWVAQPLQIYKAWYYQNLGSFGKESFVLQQSRQLYHKNFPPVEAQKVNFLALDDVVFKAVAENPDIQFHIFLPPYSLLYYASMPPADYARALQMRRYLGLRSQEFPNAHFYAFDILADIPVADLNQYKDKGHYHPDVNRKMVAHIKNGRGILTSANVDRHIQELHNRIQEFCRKAAENDCVRTPENTGQNANP